MENVADQPRLKELSIAKIPLFAALSGKELEQLSDALLLREYRKGASIMIAAQESREVMFVADGSVDVKRSGPDGREVILARLAAGDLFGEIALLTNSTRSADVIASEDALVLVLRPGDFERLLMISPGFSRALLADLASRVSAASTRIADLALLDVYCRVFRVLQGLSRPHPVRSGEFVVRPRPTQKDIAAMAGTRREMVTRAIGALEADGLIENEGEGLRILGELPSGR